MRVAAAAGIEVTDHNDVADADAETFQGGNDEAGEVFTTDGMRQQRQLCCTDPR